MWLALSLVRIADSSWGIVIPGVVIVDVGCWMVLSDVAIMLVGGVNRDGGAELNVGRCWGDVISGVILEG